jgi:hypothetical protein
VSTLNTIEEKTKAISTQKLVAEITSRSFNSVNTSGARFKKHSVSSDEYLATMNVTSHLLTRKSFKSKFPSYDNITTTKG